MSTGTPPARRPWRTRVVTSAAAVSLLLAWPAAAQDLDQTIDPDQPVVTETAELDRGHVDVGPRFEDGELRLLIHDDLEHDGAGSSAWRLPERTVIRVSDAATQEVPEGDAYAFLGVDPGTAVHVIPQTQAPEVVWLGWNTQDPEVMAAVDRGATLSLVGVDGPGELVVFLQSGSFEEPDVVWDSRLDGPQPAWIPVNTHAHANWIFTAPGTYLLRFETSADLIDGTQVTDTTDLRFAVGDGTDADATLTATYAGSESTSSEGTTSAADDAAEATGGAASGGAASGAVTTAVVFAVVLALVAAALLLRGRREKARAAAPVEP